MPYSTTIRAERFVFADLREVFAKANEEKSGDRLAGIAASSERDYRSAGCIHFERRHAKIFLAGKQ